VKHGDHEKEGRDCTRALLVAFARAASKAQEIEALLKDTVIAVEVANDTRDRSFEEIAKKIDKLPLGPLKKKYVETVAKDISDPGFKELFEDINQQRIFLMHKFFQVFPVEKLDANKEAESKLREINETLNIGCEVLSRAFRAALDLSLKIKPEELRDFLARFVEHRKKARVSE
jgi:hypothetical protein